MTSLYRSPFPYPIALLSVLLMPNIGAASQDGAFIENAGQWDAQAQFMANLPGVNVWVTERGAVYDFYQARGQREDDFPIKNQKSKIINRRGHVVRMEFVGGTPGSLVGVGPQEAKSHYFSGNNPDKWVTNVRHFEEVRTQKVYPGIEARWYTQGNKPRYDLIVAPGADPRQIALRFSGANWVSTDGKTLRLLTSLGEVRHTDLVAFQGDVRVPCEMRLRGNELRFEIGAYDRSKPLVIDPLVWSTFIGAGGYEYVHGLATDAQSNVVICGYEQGYSYPITEGAYSIIDTDTTGFVSKLDASKGKLLWSTFLSVSDGTASMRDVVVAPDGKVWVTGVVGGQWFPTTAGALMRTPRGNADSFVSCFSQDGSKLLASTYLGGSQSDNASAIALDSLGRPIVVGQTASTNFPVTAGAFSTTNAGLYDGFVSRLSADCKKLEASTYLGGADTNDLFGSENIRGVAVDSVGRVVVAGTTPSFTFPTTAGAIRTTATLGEAFITRFSSGLKTLVGSTLLGGNSSDGVAAVALDSADNAVVIGSTTSADFPITAGAFSTTLPATGLAFVAKINPLGTSLLRSTRWVQDSFLSDVAVLPEGIAVIGTTSSSSFPTTLDSFDPSWNGVVTDGTFSILDPSLRDLLHSAFVGGTDSEEPRKLATAPDASIVVTGETWSTDFPTTAGAFRRDHWGATEIFVTKLSLRHPATLTLSKTSLVGGFGLEGTVTIDKPAPILGANVILTSNLAGMTLPSVVKIGPGLTSKTFAIGTPGVASKKTVKVTASAGGTSISQTLTLTVGGLISLTIDPTSVARGSSATGTVTLSAKAPAAGRTVSLSSNVLFATVPASVTIPAGQTSATFTINTDAGGSTGPALITAKLGTASLSTVLTVTP